jgi:hypothetical protein
MDANPKYGEFRAGGAHPAFTGENRANGGAQSQKNGGRKMEKQQPVSAKGVTGTRTHESAPNAGRDEQQRDEGTKRFLTADYREFNR